MEVKKKIAVYVFECLVKVCEADRYKNTDEAGWMMECTHSMFDLYNEHKHLICEALSELKRAGFVDKVVRQGKHGQFTRLKPSKLGMERYNKLKGVTA